MDKYQDENGDWWVRVARKIAYHNFAEEVNVSELSLKTGPSIERWFEMLELTEYNVFTEPIFDGD